MREPRNSQEPVALETADIGAKGYACVRQTRKILASSFRHGARYNTPSRIATLGHYYPKDRIGAAGQALKEARADYGARTAADPQFMSRNLGWTKLVNALNDERQWPLKRLIEILDPMLEPDIALAVVPTHIAYQPSGRRARLRSN